MSDIMRPMPFAHLMNWILSEYKSQGSIFGVSKLVKHTNGKALPIFEEKIESPYGPAAGPHTQLAQNIIAAYAAGSRFFEVKTVQVMDGDELSKCVNKPCITAADECYNCEWSTELYVPQARRVRQGLVRLQAVGQGAGAGRSQRLRVQHERRLRPGRHQE